MGDEKLKRWNQEMKERQASRVKYSSVEIHEISIEVCYPMSFRESCKFVSERDVYVKIDEKSYSRKSWFKRIGFSVKPSFRGGNISTIVFELLHRNPLTIFWFSRLMIKTLHSKSCLILYLTAFILFIIHHVVAYKNLYNVF